LNHVPLNIDRQNWHDLQLFLALAASGSVRGAAREMRLSVNTVRTRLDLIEHLSGEALVERSAKGLRLTKAGRQLQQIAERMQAAAEAEAGAKAAADTEPAVGAHPGGVRLSVTEGLAAYWLMPRLAKFQRDNPDTVIHLRTGARAADQSMADADIAIQLRPPDDPDFDVEEIGTLHMMPFASPAYLAERGTPKHFDEWRAHRLVWQDWEPEAQAIMPLFIADDAPSRIISMVTAGTPAQFAAIKAGMGLGFLPTYIARITTEVRPVDFGLQFRRAIYLIVRRTACSPMLDNLAATLRESFADQTLFGETFRVPD
jgi:DNA-binding transcriptional LysR family regulator